VIAKAVAQAAASPPVTAPAVPQVGTTAATDGVLATAVAAKVAVTAPKAVSLKAGSVQTQAATSGDADTVSDPTATAGAANTTTAAQQLAAAGKQKTADGAVDAANADDSASSAPATAISAHDHSATAATGNIATDTTDAGAQAAALIQPTTAVTAVPAAALTVTAATHAAVPLSGLALEIAVSAQSGKSRFEIRLDPAELGRIDVRIDVDSNGQVTSHLTVEKPETLSMLQQDAPQLQRALDDAGLKTGNGGLQFSLRDQSSSGQNDGGNTGRNAQRLVVSDESALPASVAGRTYGRLLGSSSGVDISV
jgi:flagellar hook-length control protein FliK